MSWFWVVSKNKKSGKKWTWSSLNQELQNFYPESTHTIDLRAGSYNSGNYMSINKNESHDLVIRISLNKTGFCDEKKEIDFPSIPKNSFVFYLPQTDSVTNEVVKKLKLKKLEDVV